ncbi:hypothetical protein [Mycolicibacterium sp.]|uniref:hypothetical protein n=1 Tax=Mycolicibacterium sp. TaxID=2320850 RepID=UPI003D0DA9BA
MTGSMTVTLGLLAGFFGLVVFVLYATNRNAKSFSDYAVGGRSFGNGYIAMSYTNSWWPGATYTAFFGLSVSAGVLGFYALAYSVLGVTAMYLMAERAWLWGKRYDLKTQPGMLGLRFDSQAVRVIASTIGVVCLFPWIVLGMQAMGLIFKFTSFGRWSVTTYLVVGVAVIAIRQIWTVHPVGVHDHRVLHLVPAAGPPGSGPGRGRSADRGVAHADDEFCPIDEVRIAARTYAALALDWCGIGS